MSHMYGIKHEGRSTAHGRQAVLTDHEVMQHVPNPLLQLSSQAQLLGTVIA